MGSGAGCVGVLVGVGAYLHRVTAAGQGLPVQPLCDQCCVILIIGDSGGALLVQQTAEGETIGRNRNRPRRPGIFPGGELDGL